MTPAFILRELEADGMRLTLSSEGTLKVRGVQVAVACTGK